MKMQNGMPYYRTRLYRFIVQFVKDRSLAEDLTQDIMLKLWCRNDKLSAIEDLDNYILKMAKHHVIDHFKKLAKEKSYQEKIWYHIQNSDNTAESKLAVRDIDAQLEIVIKTLPQRQQEVYNLSKREGLSLREIATTLGITIRTARNHLDRALKVIRNNMNTDSILLWITVVTIYVSITLNK